MWCFIINVVRTISIFLCNVMFFRLLAFTVLLFEAPYCCMFIDYVQEGSKWIENRPYWNRAAYYML